MAKERIVICVNDLSELDKILTFMLAEGYAWASGHAPTHKLPMDGFPCYISVHNDKTLTCLVSVSEETLSVDEFIKSIEGVGNGVTVCPGDIHKAMSRGIDHDPVLKRVTDRNPALFLVCIAIAECIEREIFGEKGEEEND